MVKGAHHRRFCVVICLGVIIQSHAQDLDRQIKKLSYNNNGFGSYSFEFETADGTFRREEGGLVSNKVNDNKVLTVRGEYGYRDLNGQLYHVRYIADDNGFQPQLTDVTSNTRYNDRRIL